MGCVQKGGGTVSAESGSQSQTETLGGWQKSDHCCHEETLGGCQSGQGESWKVGQDQEGGEESCGNEVDFDIGRSSEIDHTVKRDGKEWS
jgi:hypothetical protein